jgi:branched-chain amino acid aminotransferase
VVFKALGIAFMGVKKKIFIFYISVSEMQETEFIWLNGKLVKWKDAKIHVLSHALHYGSGAFEGVRCYETEKGPAIFRLEEHVARMLKSFSIFGVSCPYTQEKIENAIKETVKANKLKEGYIRPILFFGYGEMGLKNLGKSEINLAIACWPWGSYLGDKAIDVEISKIKRISPESFRTDAKICGHYVNSILASLSVGQQGHDEAIMLDYKGNVAEGSGENIFIIKNGKIYTPKLGSILPGITRDSIMAIAKDLGYDVLEKSLTIGDVKNASEVFLTGTAAEVTAVKQVDDTIIVDGEIGPITKKLQTKYLEIVHGKDKKYEKWLSYIK